MYRSSFPGGILLHASSCRLVNGRITVVGGENDEGKPMDDVEVRTVAEIQRITSPAAWCFDAIPLRRVCRRVGTVVPLVSVLAWVHIGFTPGSVIE